MERNRDLARRGTGAIAAENAWPSEAGPVTPRVGAVLTGWCRRSYAHRRAGAGRGARRLGRGGRIALGSFALVFSEVIPVGLLAGISGHLRVPVGTGGLMVVVPAAAAAVAAPVLALCSARLERRRMLAGLSVLVLVSDVIAGLAPGIGVMLAARAVLGIGVGGFWVFGAGAAIAW